MLSLIGLGAEPGSWGVLIAYGRQWMLAAPWMTLMSGLALTSLLLGHYAFGSGLKNLLTPHGPSSDSPAGAPEDSTDSFEWSDEHELV